MPSARAPRAQPGPCTPGSLHPWRPCTPGSLHPWVPTPLGPCIPVPLGLCTPRYLHPGSLYSWVPAPARTLTTPLPAPTADGPSLSPSLSELPSLRELGFSCLHGSSQTPHPRQLPRPQGTGLTWNPPGLLLPTSPVSPGPALPTAGQCRPGGAQGARGPCPGWALPGGRQVQWRVAAETWMMPGFAGGVSADTSAPGTAGCEW